jgi:hypothetical protein
MMEVLGPVPWIDAGAFARRGAEISLARFIPAGFGYLLQAWTASETPSTANVIGDIAAGSSHGYCEISYHWGSGSRISLGATYYGADLALGQPAVVPLNSNLEIQIRARRDPVRRRESEQRPLCDPDPGAPGPRAAQRVRAGTAHVSRRRPALDRPNRNRRQVAPSEAPSP